MKTIKLISLMMILGVSSVNAQESKEELSESAASPLADLISFPCQNNLKTQLYYNVVHPDFGQEWQWRIQAQILLPTNIFGWELNIMVL